MRCRHPNATVVEIRDHGRTQIATIECKDCDLTLYTPVRPWISNHACHRVHKAPQWAQRLIDRAAL